MFCLHPLLIWDLLVIPSVHNPVLPFYPPVINVRLRFRFFTLQSFPFILPFYLFPSVLFVHLSVLSVQVFTILFSLAQLVNKYDGLPFTKNDENFLEAFAIFCGIGVTNTHM